MRKLFICLLTLTAGITWILASAQNTYAQPKLQQVFADDTYQFTGVAVSAKNRLFVTLSLIHI